MHKPTSQLRLLHYLDSSRQPQGAKAKVQMGAHTDYECFTLLHQRRQGLQVMDRSDRWLNAPPIEGTLLVNIGDMLEVWSNGLFQATPHRVLNSGQERYSLPYFCAADFDAVIEPLPSLVSAGQDHPPRYGKTIAGYHLLRHLLRDFSYLRERRANGELKLPFAPSDTRFHSQFEQRLAAA